VEITVIKQLQLPDGYHLLLGAERETHNTSSADEREMQKVQVKSSGTRDQVAAILLEFDKIAV